MYQHVFRLFSVSMGEAVSALMLSAPQGPWVWLSGRLEAPPDLERRGLLLSNTGYQFGRYGIGEGFLQPIEENCPVDTLGVVEGSKWPHFITFVETGRFGRRPDTLQAAKAVAVLAHRRGYRGSLTLSCVQGIQRDSAWMVIQSAAPEPCVQLGWDPQLGGSEEFVQPLLEACEALGLPRVGDLLPVA